MTVALELLTPTARQAVMPKVQETLEFVVPKVRTTTVLTDLKVCWKGGLRMARRLLVT